MATIDLDSDMLTVRLHGWDPLFALRKTVKVPLAQVRGARPRPSETRFDELITDGDAGTGLLFRGQLAIGSIAVADGFSFYDVHDTTRRERVLAIDLEGAEFAHIVIDLDDETPDDAARRINAAVAAGTTPVALRNA